MDYYDYVFEGGTLKNIYNALKLKNLKILILTKNTYLGDEITCGNNYGFPKNRISDFFIDIEKENQLIHPDKFKQKLEDICIDAGIKFYYCTYIATICDGVMEIVSKGGTKKISYGTHIQQDILIGNKFNAYIEKENEYKLYNVEAKNRFEGIEKILETYPRELTLGRMGEYTFTELNIEEYLESPLLQGEIKQTSYKEYDFVVVGGGTSGTMCALHLGRSGFKTLIIDINNALGGSGTVGGVSTYWFGKNYSDVKEVDDLVDEICIKYGIYQKEGIWGKDDFHPDIKAFVFEKLCREANVDIEFKSIYYDCDKDKKIIKYVNDAINEVKYKWVIDATGDGDVAKDFGSDYVYGDKSITFWTSLAQYKTTREYKNNFFSSVFLDDFDDYTDFIYTARRRGDTFDHGTYVSMRESRHIIGKTVIDLEDIIMFRTYDDGFYTSYSNYDPKGKLNNKMINFGFLPSQNSIQVPLSACIPTINGTEINNIVVIGKAISCTHDAFAPLRMQKDLMHQGTAMAMALAEVVDKKSLTEVNLNILKDKIATTGDNLKLDFVKYKNKCRSHWVDQLFEVEVKELPYVHEMIVNGKENIERLIADYTFATEVEDKIFFAKLLLYNGDTRGEKLIYDYVVTNLENELPKRNGITTCVTLQPDHGVMPETVYAIHALGYGSCKNFDFLDKVFEYLQSERDYFDNTKGIYHYIEVFANLYELTADKNIEQYLLKILNFEEFEYYKKSENRFDIMSQRILILLLSIYTALAKKGSEIGLMGLKELSSSYDKTIQSSSCMQLKDLMLLDCSQ